ncbi:MAG: 30S ribosomal protein S13 [Promethearchaeota archaeon]|nr:MAG: 30S ribosomal protein S13 [Candidatus Lokiarchaeota archaeon]
MSSAPIRPKSFKEQIFFRQLRTRVDGNARVEYGITQIKGIGKRFAQAVVRQASIDPSMRMGALSEKQLEKIEEVILNPEDNGIPNWMYNRNKDIKTGKDRHVLGNQLEISTKRDIDRMKKIRSYKGIRHRLGLKVRGQRTKSTGRGELVIGVIRKKIRQQQEAKGKKKKKEKKAEKKE